MRIGNFQSVIRNIEAAIVQFEIVREHVKVGTNEMSVVNVL